MKNPLSREKISDQTELFRQILITLLKRSAEQTDEIQKLTERIDNLTAVVVQQKTRESFIPKGKQQITTAVALVIFALTVLALILKGCLQQ